jgi:hypothetical protein
METVVAGLEALTTAGLESGATISKIANQQDRYNQQTERPGSRLGNWPFLLVSRVELNGVGGGGDAAALAGPVGVEELAAWLVDALIGVGAEVVALGLE